ncbi:vWA domain-containing protein [Tautonia marina]|uniref:vWA domain-containing protein n=1 Tax=Tautonia marina TaxID=2653855 RepID=UPI0012611C2D|nr:VWA domain-containing protein [Tautonia marina]
MRLAEPWWLILLVLAAMPWVAEWVRPRVQWSSLRIIPPRAWRQGGAGWLRQVCLGFRALAIACLVVAIARPQTVAGRTLIAGRGVSILLAVDQSLTMTAEDVPIDDTAFISRLEAARRTIDRFIRGRPDDLIGLVGFGTYPDLICPPTLDHDVLRALLASLEPARPGENATNIGDAIAWSLQAVLDTEPSEGVIVLLTDGQNEPDAAATPDWLDPDEAAMLVQRLGARLYTIGIGAPGGMVRIDVPGTGISYPEQLQEGYDPVALDRWAELGNGAAFSAESAEMLDQVFDRIDTLEKRPFTGEILTRYREEYSPWVVAALVLLVIDRVAVATRTRRLP